MTTTEIKTVKPAGGGDYTTIRAWSIGRAANLTSLDEVRVAEVYSGGNALDDFWAPTNHGWVTDATRYIEVRAAAGQGHDGARSLSKAYTQNQYIVATDVNLHIKRMQLINSGGSVATIANHSASSGKTTYLDQCLIYGYGAYPTQGVVRASSSGEIVLRNCVIIVTGDALAINADDDAIMQLYNCDIIANLYGAGVGIVKDAGASVTTQDCYICANTCYGSAGISKGSKDATSNTEATDPGLRNIPYSTATFVSVTIDAEDLHLANGSALIDVGADTSAQGVTVDFTGGIRPFNGIYDIGADEWGSDEPPICWNYTAKFKGSQKLFKTSGGGAFPKNLRIPDNVDRSTGRMIDDGKEIDPDHYEVF